MLRVAHVHDESTQRFRSPIFRSFFNIVVYHLGSLALGSLIITAVRVPRYIIMWLLAKLTCTCAQIVEGRNQRHPRLL